MEMYFAMCFGGEMHQAAVRAARSGVGIITLLGEGP